MAPAGGVLEAKHYILAAFTAGFVAVAVVTTVFVVLSPARIHFSVVSASSHDDSGDGGFVQLDLTIAANNTSRRAAVLYQSMFVSVSNGSSFAGPQSVNWVRADVATAMPLRQPPRDVAKIHATAKVLLLDGEAFTGNKTNHSFSVMVTAVAGFKVGIAWTRLYEIKITCGNVDFFANKSSTTDCHDA